VPWKPQDAQRHTKKADTPKKQKQWADLSTRLLAAGKPEGEAVKTANGVIKRESGRK